MVDNKLKYLAMMTSMGCPSKRAEQLESECLEGILFIIKNQKCINSEQALAMPALLKDRLPGHMITSVMSAVDARVDLGAAVDKSSPDKQVCLYMDKLLTDALWDLFQQPHTHDREEQLLMVMAMVFATLGIKKGNERTHALGAALATQSLGFDVNRLLNATRSLKRHVEAANQASNLLMGPWIYPSDAKTLQEQHPDIFQQAFQGGQPAPSRWTDITRQMVLRLSVCRSSRTGTCEAPARSRQSNGQSNQLMNRACSLEALPGFTWTSTPQPGGSASAGPQQQASAPPSTGGLLSICNGQLAIGICVSFWGPVGASH